MIVPTFARLEKLKTATPTVHYCSGSPDPMGNPRLFKHVWQVFSPRSPWEGELFFEHAPWLCGAGLELELEQLREAGLSCLVYGARRPRRDPANPWDMDKPRWRGAVFAPSWDDDTDPLYAGGHK